MAIIGLMLFLWPSALISAFTTDQRVIDIGVRLLAIAAAFQLFDGTQAVVTGVLRGIGETRMPMIINVIGHWLFGLPVGYALCFWYAWGVLGLWIGLSIGLVFTALVLTAVWWNRTQHYAYTTPTATSSPPHSFLRSPPVRRGDSVPQLCDDCSGTIPARPRHSPRGGGVSSTRTASGAPH
jgi:hypothetical protein